MPYCTRCYGFHCTCKRKTFELEVPRVEITLPKPVRVLDALHGSREVGSLRGDRLHDLLGQDTGRRLGPGTMCGDRIVNDVIGRPVGRLDIMGNLRPLI